MEARGGLPLILSLLISFETRKITMAVDHLAWKSDKFGKLRRFFQGELWAKCHVKLIYIFPSVNSQFK